MTSSFLSGEMNAQDLAVNVNAVFSDQNRMVLPVGKDIVLLDDRINHLYYLLHWI